MRSSPRCCECNEEAQRCGPPPGWMLLRGHRAFSFTLERVCRGQFAKCVGPVGCKPRPDAFCSLQRVESPLPAGPPSIPLGPACPEWGLSGAEVSCAALPASPLCCGKQKWPSPSPAAGQGPSRCPNQGQKSLQNTTVLLSLVSVTGKAVWRH